MKGNRVARIARYTVSGLLLIAGVATVGCVRISGGTWYVRSAAAPDGWPDLTAVGEVEVKEYPACRAAIVAEADLTEGGTEPMFMTLFRHIQANDIAMTAPVEMSYGPGGAAERQMTSMGFLYRHPTLGQAVSEGPVRVVDLEPQTFASVGVRGDYTADRFEAGLALLRSWLEVNASEWIPIGPPRYLGYNGPFVPKFMRYGEVQLPVRVPGAQGTNGPR